MMKMNASMTRYQLTCFKLCIMIFLVQELPKVPNYAIYYLNMSNFLTKVTGRRIKISKRIKGQQNIEELERKFLGSPKNFK